MKTKYYVKFLNRAAHFDADIELADVIAIASKSGVLHKKYSKFMFDGVDPEHHPRLAVRINNSHNRNLAIKHLRNTLYASFIKDAYEDVLTCMQDILEAAARNGLNPGRLIGDHKVTFDANDILRLKTYDAIVNLTANSVFRKLQNNKNTKLLLENINSKLNLDVDQTKISNALPYLEIRHLLVHADGIADQKFCDTYQDYGASLGKKIKLDYAVLKDAKKALLELVEAFDIKVIACNIIATANIQG